MDLVSLLVSGALLFFLSLLVPSYPSKRRKVKRGKKIVGQDPVEIALKNLKKDK